MDLLSWIFGADLQDRTRPILIDPANPSNALSWNQIRTKVRQLVAGLHTNGIKPGECVLVNAFNDVLYTVLYLGIIGSGGIFTEVNPAYTPDELVNHCKLTQPSIILAEPSVLDKTLEAAARLGISKERIFVFTKSSTDAEASVRFWTELLRYGERDWIAVTDPATTIAHYASTSGTSGLPKIAKLSHQYHVTQAELQVKALQDATLQAVTRRLTPLPPFHVFATPITASSIRMGIETYIMPRFEMASFVSHVKQYQITETYLVPPTIVAISQSPLAVAGDLESLRQIWFGGASLKYQNRIPMYKRLHPDAKIQPVWGMTEAGWITCGRPNIRFEDDSVGWQLDGVEVLVVDGTGKSVSPSTKGELLVKALAPMLGYVCDEEATNATLMTDGWVKTGDVGYVEEGKVFVVDRKKDLIKVRGWAVSPAEVEAVLLEHPDIQDAAVVAIDKGDGIGEIVRAYIVWRSEANAKYLGLKGFATHRLSKFKVPEEFVFTQAIPRNPTGKILRNLLRAESSRKAVSLR